MQDKNILKAIRCEAGISRVHLSNKTGIPYPRLVRIEQQYAKMTIDELSSISIYFGKPIPDFFAK